MSDDLALQMYEAQAELVETRQELERIQRGNDELRNERAANHLMRTVDDFQRNYSNRFETMEDNLRVLTTAVSSSDKILSEINETLRKQNKDIDTLKKDMKTMNKETILLVGGKSGDKVVDSLIIPQNNGENDGDWKELDIKLPYAVNGHGAQFLNNYLYIFGGYNEKNETLNSSYKLTGGHKLLNNSLQWEKIKDMNQKRTEISNSSVILNERIWVIGGFNEKNYPLKSVEMYDPQTNIWTNMKPTNQCRIGAAAAGACGKIFCCGDWNKKTRSSSAECYDPSSDVWTLISDMPGPDEGCGIVVMDAHLVVIGGRTSEGEYLNSVWVLDTTDKNAKWIEKETRLSHPRSGFSIGKIAGKIFVCGGMYGEHIGSSIGPVNNIEIFDEGVWKNGPKMPPLWFGTPVIAIPTEFARSLN